MQIWETVLIYLGAPLAATALIALWSAVSWVPKHKYYTLGEKWTSGPIWWAAVDEKPWHVHGGGHAVEAGINGGAASGKW